MLRPFLLCLPLVILLAGSVLADNLPAVTAADRPVPELLDVPAEPEWQPAGAADQPARPGSAPSAAVDEQSLRDAVTSRPSPQAYLALIASLQTRTAQLKPGDEKAGLEAELGKLWPEVLTRYPADPDVLLANGDRLRAHGSLQAAWESYSQGEKAAPSDPRWTLRLAGLKQAAADYAGAVKLYDESLRLAYSAAAVAGKAEAQRLNGDPRAALATWNDALAAHPQDAALRMEYGLALYAQHNYTEALAQYQRGAELDGRNDLFHNRAALCLYALDRTAEAMDEVSAALAINPQPLYFYNLAVGYEQLGEYDLAEQWYRKGLGQYPGDGRLSRAFGEFLDDRGRSGEALAQLSTTASDADAPRDWANLAELAEQQGDVTTASAAWEKALAADPTSPVTLTTAAAYYARSGQDARLRELVRTSRSRLDTEEFTALLDAVGQEFIHLADFAAGTAVFRDLLADHANVTAVYNNLGLLLHLSGDSAGGLAMVRRGISEVNDTTLGRYLEVFLTGKVQGVDAALALAPAMIQHPEAGFAAYELYSGMLAERKQWNELGQVAQAGLAKFPRRGPLLEYRARALLAQGKPTETAALLADPQYARLEFPGKARLLGHAYIQLGNYGKAVGAYAQAVKALPGEASEGQQAAALASLGEAQYWAGDLPAARTSLTDALALDPKSSDAQLWLGWTLLAQLDFPGATEALAHIELRAGELDKQAWLSIAQARLFLQQGNLSGAGELAAQARQVSRDSKDPRIANELAALKGEIEARST